MENGLFKTLLVALLGALGCLVAPLIDDPLVRKLLLPLVIAGIFALLIWRYSAHAANRRKKMIPLLLGLLGLVLYCGSAVWYWYENRPIKVAAGADAAAAPVQPPADLGFNLHGNAKLTNNDAYMEAVPHGLYQGGDNTEGTFNRLTVVDPTKPLVWPNANASYAKVPKKKLAHEAMSLATQLRAIHMEYEESTKDISLPIAELKARGDKADTVQRLGFDKIKGDCLMVGSALAARQGIQIVPRDPRPNYLGSEVIILGRLSGIDPVLNAAIALELLAKPLM